MKLIKSTYLQIIAACCLTLMLAAGCSAEQPEPVGGNGGGDALISISVSVPTSNSQSTAEAQSAATRGASPLTRSPFDVFDNEADKWGIAGENMESLRIIIIAGNGEVEHNYFQSLSDASTAGEYEFTVKAADTKTILLFANEIMLRPDVEGMEIAGGVESLRALFDSLTPGTTADVDRLRRLTLALAHNSVDDRGESFATPLPISAIYTESIPAAGSAEPTVIRREYLLHRAAVKYSFRIVNLSKFDHSLEKLRIDRVADREFLFPDADWSVNERGESVISTYRTPASAREQSYTSTLLNPLSLPAGMTTAVEAIAPIYIPEGLIAESPQRISLALDGQDLDVWQDLKWIMPGESQAAERPMCDLPRNTHVVVNITITEKGELTCVADVQPYAEIVLKPWFGLDRDEDGNIIINRYEDGTYDIMDDDGNTITRDSDGDRVIQRFADGSILCQEIVYKDYIHDSSEVDYIYYFEKDTPGGNMVIIRETTYHGTHHEVYDPAHNHDSTDRPMFILDKEGTFHRVSYDATGEPTLHRTDIHGDTIVQANGFQYIGSDLMDSLFGTYIVSVETMEDGKPSATEELRWYKDGSSLSWPAALMRPSSSSSSASISSYFPQPRIKRYSK